jgi:uncharacterized membrane protein
VKLARFGFVFLLVAVAAAPLRAAGAQQASPVATVSSTVEELAHPTGSTGAARAINDNGIVVGWTGDYNAWITGEGSIDLRVWAGDETTSLGAVMPIDISNDGLIVGIKTVLLEDETYLDTPMLFRAGEWEELALLEDGVTAMPIAINEAGIIAGQADGRPATWDELGEINLLEDLGSGGSANGINERGQRSGWVADDKGRLFAASWTETGTLELLEEPDGLTESIAYGLNDEGVFVGYGYSETKGYLGIVWTDGEPEYLELPDTSYQAFPTEINNDGLIAGVIWGPDAEGYTGAFWRGGEVVELVALEDYPFAQIDDLNAGGQVAGYVYEGDVNVPVVWTIGKAEIDLDGEGDAVATPRINWMTGKEEATPEAGD